MRSDRRKDRRRRIAEGEERGFGLRRTLYIAGTILALGVIAFFVTVMIYNNSLDKLYSDLETQEIGKAQEDTEYGNNLQEASANLGKTVEEMINEIEDVSAENEEVKEVATKQETETKQEEKEVKEKTKSEEKEASTEKVEEKKEEVKEQEKELVFSMPVEGEMQKEYAVDKLVYSETLKEWVTHTGIDIKAEKTTVVKASEAGTVTAIKNDPRYGITVIIEHSGRI